MSDNQAMSRTGISMSQEFLGHILGAIYDAALDEAGWVSCLETIRTGFAGNYASLIVRTETTEDIGLIVSAGINQSNLDPGNPYIAMSPFVGMVPDQIVTISRRRAVSRMMQ